MVLSLDNSRISTNITVSEHLFSFKELVSCLLACNPVAWTLIHKHFCKCFRCTWYIGNALSYHLQRKWFAVKYCDEIEEYLPAELALIYFSDLLPTLFFLKFDFSVHVMAEAYTGLLCSPFFVTFGAI
jgi:hypothetical protein